MKTEYVKCNLCKKDNTRRFIKKDDATIVKCQNCGLIYVNPRLTQESLSRLYNENKISPVPYFKENKEEDKKTFNERLKLIEKYTNKRILLDVGCNIGTLLEVAQKRGWNAQGIDINKEAIEEAKKNNLNVECTTIENIKEMFDVIIMNDFIEHVSDPNDTIKRAKALLKEQGLLFIVTPDIDTITFKILQKHWFHLKPKEHIYYFTKETITKMLKNNGFTLIERRYRGRYRNISTILEKGFRIKTKLNAINIKLNTLDELCIIARKQ